MAVKRVLALLLALGMVFGAQAFRNRVEDPAAGEGPDGRPPAGDPGDLVLVCDPGLEEVCATVAGELEVEILTLAPAAAATRLADPGDEGLRGAWLTLAPWVEVATLRQQATGGSAVLGDAALLARSPLVAAVWEERAEVLEDHCGGSLTWRCAGDAAAGSWAAVGGPDAWGPVKLGRSDGGDDAEGLLLLGQVAAGYHDRSDLTRADVDDNAFFAWFSRLEDARPPLPPGAASPIEAMVSFGAATLDLAGVLEAQAAPFLARTAARAPTLRLRVIEPVATAALVVAAIGDDDDARELAGDVGEVAPGLLAAAGWRVEGEPLAPALGQVGVDLPEGLPSQAGLPPAGTLLALQELAQEVGR